MKTISYDFDKITLKEHLPTYDANDQGGFSIVQTHHLSAVSSFCHALFGRYILVHCYNSIAFFGRK